MIIDLKYHIASIVAVFLALGIGILVGTALIGNNVNDVIVDQQNRMFEQLKADLYKMRYDNRTAKEEIAYYKSSLELDREFNSAVMPLLTTGKLKGKKIAIIETNYSSLHDDWIETLRNAGATITSITSIVDGFSLQDETKRKQISTKLMIDNSSPGNVAREISNEIAAGIKCGQNMENLYYFENQGIINISGTYGVPVDSVIIAGGSNNKQHQQCENIDIQIINYFLKNNVTVLGVENSNDKYSYMKFYQKQRITTVDNVDMASGQFSLIMAAAGKEGNYGIKGTAQRLIPILP